MRSPLNKLLNMIVDNAQPVDVDLDRIDGTLYSDFSKEETQKLIEEFSVVVDNSQSLNEDLIPINSVTCLWEVNRYELMRELEIDNEEEYNTIINDLPYDMIQLVCSDKTIDTFLYYPEDTYLYIQCTGQEADQFLEAR